MRRFALILITLFSALGVALAQTTEEQKLAIGYLHAAMDAEAEGSVASAIEFYQQAAEYAQSGFGEKHEFYHMALFGLVGNYFRMGLHKHTIEYGEILVANKELRTTHPAEYALTCYNLSISYGTLQQYDKSVEYGLQSVEIWDKVGTDDTTAHLYADLCGMLAEALYSRDNIALSIEYSTRALTYFSNNAEQYPINYAITLYELGIAHNHTGDIPQSINYMLRAEQALTPYRGYSDDVDALFGGIYHTLGSSYSLLGQQSKGVGYMKLAQPLLEKNIEQYEPLYVFNQLSLASDAGAKGDFVTAERYAEQVLPMLATVREHAKDIKYATIITQLAQYRHLLGDEEEAAKLFNEALAIYSSYTAEQQPDLRYYILMEALCYDWLGRHNEALECYLRLLDMVRSDADALPEELAEILSELTNSYAVLGISAESINYGEQLISMVEEHSSAKPEGYANTLYNLVMQYNKTEGGEQRARELLVQSYIEAQLELGDYHPLCSKVLFMMCNHYYDDGDYEALSKMWFQFYKQVQDTIFKRFRHMTTRQREHFWTHDMSYMLAFGSGWYTPVLADDKAAMTTSYDAMLLSKGLLLHYEIEFDRIIRLSGDEELIAKLDEWKQYRSQINKLYAASPAERDNSEIRRIEEAADRCEQELIEKSQDYAEYNRRNRLNLHWFDVQAALGERDVAVEFMEATESKDEPYYAALVLRHDWDAPRYVYVGSSSDVEQIYKNGHKLYSEALSEQLYDMVWGALEPHINEGDNIYFAPAGLLHQINIEVLTNGEGRRANELYNPVRLSSTRELCLRPQPKPQSEAVLYGDLKYDISAESMLITSRRTRGEGKYIARRGFHPSPHLRDRISELPATADELRNIASTLGEQGIATRLLTRGDGNEESFKALSGSSPQILHIATHGFFFQDEEAEGLPFFHTQSLNTHADYTSPLRRSGLILSGGERAWLGEELPAEVEDGVLLSEEIATMDLGNVELLVLSACDTGLGEISSEGVFGLQRAFKMAGVQSIMMSLWKVDDRATALFMQSFYRTWKGGATKREAFAEAQRRVREGYNPSPEYWAAFVLLD